MHPYQPKTLALTGATGALGFTFISQLLAMAPNTRAHLLVRRSSDSFKHPHFQKWIEQEKHRVTLIDGDVRNLDALSPEDLSLLLDTDGGLWHFAAVTALNNDPAVAADIHAVNYVATERLVELIGKRSSPLFHISTAYVAGDREGLVLETENDCGQKFRNPYEASKSASEKVVQQLIASHHPASIFRPSIVIGDAEGISGFKVVDACSYSCGLAVKRGEPFVFRLNKSASMNLVHNSWVTHTLLDLSRLPSGHGHCYHLTAPRATTWMELGELVREHVPDLKVMFEPNLERRDLPSASKLFDKSINDVRPYFEANIRFDRTNTDRDLSPALLSFPIEHKSFVATRLKTEVLRASSR